QFSAGGFRVIKRLLSPSDASSSGVPRLAPLLQAPDRCDGSHGRCDRTTPRCSVATALAALGPSASRLNLSYQTFYPGAGSAETRGRSARCARARVRSPLLEWVEQLTVLFQREAVGHAGDVVGDHARQRLAVARALQDVRRQLLGLAHVGLEELGHDA